VTPAVFAARWALPSWVRREPNIGNSDVGLFFFRLFEWAGIFEANPLLLMNECLQDRRVRI